MSAPITTAPTFEDARLEALEFLLPAVWHHVGTNTAIPVESLVPLMIAHGHTFQRRWKQRVHGGAVMSTPTPMSTEMQGDQ